MMRRPPTSIRALGSPPIRTLLPPAWITPVSFTSDLSRPGKRPSADVTAELHALEPDAPDGLIGRLDRGTDVLPQGLHAEDSAPRGDQRAVAAGRARVEDIDPRQPSVGIQAFDGQPRSRSARIAWRGEHDAEGGIRSPAQRAGQAASCRHRLEHGQEVLVESRQDRLAFGIAEA